MELVEDGQVGAARVAKDVLDVALDECLVHELTACETREAEILLIMLVRDGPVGVVVGAQTLSSRALTTAWLVWAPLHYPPVPSISSSA
eukprot:scaffold181237_cov26-Tisochrysis_lutea.AAC.1